jgi:5-methylthioadenosine/S-adenosylhomocysteine deaminase
MATIGGARALGTADEVGSLEPGKAADLVWLPEHSPSLAGIHDPYQNLLGVDVAELLPRAHELAVRLATDAGLDSALAGG